MKYNNKHYNKGGQINNYNNHDVIFFYSDQKIPKTYLMRNHFSEEVLKECVLDLVKENSQEMEQIVMK